MGDGKDRRRLLLLVTVLIISTSGLSYELIAGTMATYLLGQSVTQFSFAMGWFMAAMGLGSYLTRYVENRLFDSLLKVQIVLALAGGFSAFFMFLAFAQTDNLYPYFFSISLIIGGAVGFEIPLILRIIGKYRILSLAVSEVFTYDYIGALFASLIFPLLILPYMGLVRASLFFGLFNCLAGLIIFKLSPEKKQVQRWRLPLIAVVLILLVGFIFSGNLTRWVEDILYQDPVVFSKETKYQRIVITKWRDDIRLFLNGNLQFSTRDEARYHETLVHVPISKMAEIPKSVLLLGGGDGLAVRELLKYPQIEKIIMIDLDGELVSLFKDHPQLHKVNNQSLQSAKLTIYNEDAFQWLKNNKNLPPFDLIIADLPDPNSYSLGKLYSVSFYLHLLEHLSSIGMFVTQATSATYSPAAYWCIKSTIEESLRIKRGYYLNEWTIQPFHTYIPSFGDWGFILASKNFSQQVERKLPSTRFLTRALIDSLFVFSKDIEQKQTKQINHLDNQILVRIYANSWHNWYQ